MLSDSNYFICTIWHLSDAVNVDLVTEIDLTEMISNALYNTSRIQMEWTQIIYSS